MRRIASLPGVSALTARPRNREPARPRKHPPPLLQQLIGPRIELCQGNGGRYHTSGGGFAAVVDRGGDLLPLGHFRQRGDALELDAEGQEAGVVCQHGREPCAAAGGEIAGQLVETHLLGRLGEEFDQLAGGRFVCRGAKDHQAAAAGHGDPGRLAGIVRRQRRGGPLVLHLRREAAPELADVPRSADVHGELALRELLIEVGDLAVAHLRSKTVAEEADVEVERVGELRLREGSARPVRIQQRRMCRQRQHGHRLVFIGRDENGPLAPPLLMDARHRLAPLRPRARAVRKPDRGQDVAAVEEHARVDVPGDAVQRATDDVGGPDAGEVVVLRLRSESSEVVESTDGDELRHPGVPHLRDVGRRFANVGGEQLLVRGVPRDLLDDDMNRRIAPFELGDELGHELALGTEGPEFEVFSVVVGMCRALQNQKAEGRKQKGGRNPFCLLPSAFCLHFSHPPLKPARLRPAITWGFLRIVFHTNSLR